MGSSEGPVLTPFGTQFDRRRESLADRRPVRYLGAVDDKHQVIQVIEAARKLSDAELRDVLEFLSDELKQRYKRANQIAAMALSDKDWVETVIPGKKLPQGAKGHVVEIRREQVDVHFPDYGMFSVSATMLRKIEPPADGCPKPEPGV